ncbi:MAG: hypothetical protein AVDCRST_MAG30-2842, partial [uncultured Solirubrobacteraceae bacterium]
ASRPVDGVHPRAGRARRRRAGAPGGPVRPDPLLGPIRPPNVGRGRRRRRGQTSPCRTARPLPAARRAQPAGGVEGPRQAGRREGRPARLPLQRGLADGKELRLHRRRVPPRPVRPAPQCEWRRVDRGL